MNKTYYVYKLIDPRDNKVFYVGKGKGRRMHEHEMPSNLKKLHPKCDIIKAIHAASLKVVKEIAKDSLTNDQAYRLEMKLIKELGRGNLTNRTDGGAGAPAWVVADPTLSVDTSIMQIILKIMRNTLSFTQPVRFYFAGELVAIDKSRCDKLYESLRFKLSGLIKKRGLNWVNSLSEQSNIEFRLSKIEGFR